VGGAAIGVTFVPVIVKTFTNRCESVMAVAPHPLPGGFVSSGLENRYRMVATESS
jgi:hypothetical protein